jgi:hypothetical protein
MTNRMYMYLAEERLEEETKVWSGSTQPATEKSSNWCPLHETSGHDASECRGLGKGNAKGKGGKGGKQKGKGSKGKRSDSEGCWTCGSSSHQQRDCPKDNNNPGKEEGDKPNAWGRTLTIEERSALQGYATHHNKLTKDVDLATIRADGGVEKWALKVEKKVKFEPPGPRQRRVEPMQREESVLDQGTRRQDIDG